MCILKGCKDRAARPLVAYSRTLLRSRKQRACSLLRRSLFSRVIFQNRPQRYDFLRTQQNKMHKNDRNVHTSVVLCNKDRVNEIS